MMELSLDIRCLADEFGHQVRGNMERTEDGHLRFDFYCSQCPGPVFIEGLPRPAAVVEQP